MANNPAILTPKWQLMLINTFLTRLLNWEHKFLAIPQNFSKCRGRPSWQIMLHATTAGRAPPTRLPSERLAWRQHLNVCIVLWIINIFYVFLHTHYFILEAHKQKFSGATDAEFEATNIAYFQHANNRLLKRKAYEEAKTKLV